MFTYDLYVYSTKILVERNAFDETLMKAAFIEKLD